MARTTPIDPRFWSERSVLLTGHTGFKGAWLSLWLQTLGARVTGLAQAPPTEPSLYRLACVGDRMSGEFAVDVRDAPAVRAAVRAACPEVVFHLAAQPMVRLSLREPALTFEVNVLGTVNLLEAVRLAGDSVQAVVVVTSDKCYANPSTFGPAPVEDRGPIDVQDPVIDVQAPVIDVQDPVIDVQDPVIDVQDPVIDVQDPVIDGQDPVIDVQHPASAPGPAPVPARRFVESDPLGGHDPYSSSKACAELVTAAYRESFFSAHSADVRVRVASARAGNVIGGGDFGEERLIPDILRAHAAGRPVLVRNPDAVRPWQHVLNPLSGYLCLAQALCGREAGSAERPGSGAETGRAYPDANGARADEAARAWNFGPLEQDCQTVLEIVRHLEQLLDGGLSWELDTGPHPPEASRLELDSSAADALLGWRPRWNLDDALARVARWNAAQRAGDDMRRISLEEIAEFD